MRRLGWIAVCAVLAGCPKGGKEEVADAGPVDAGPDVLSEKEPNERPDQALTLARDAVVSAALSADPAKGDEDWYRLAPPSARTADITVSGIPGGDVQIEVYDRDRNRLASVNSEGENKPEHFPNLFVEGERYVRVASARKGSGGSYTLTLTYRRPNDGEEREPNDRAVDATPLTLGQTVAAYIGHAGDEDWYRIELPAQAAPSTPGTIPDEEAPVPAPKAPAPTQAPPPTPAPPEGATPTQAEGTPPAGEGATPSPAPTGETPPAEGSTPPPDGTTPPPANGAPTGSPTGTPGAVAQVKDAGTAAPPEPPGVALKIELSALEGVRPELAVLSAAEAPLFSLRGKEGEALALRNIGVRATDQVVYVVVKSSWVGTGKDAKRAYNATNPYTLSVSLEEAGANAELEPNDELYKATPITGSGFKEGFLAPKSDVDYYVLKTTEPMLAKVEVSGVERLDLVLSAVDAPASDSAQETVTLKANDGALKEPERLNNVSCNGSCYFKVEGASRKVEGKWVKDFENADQPYRITVTAVPDDGSQEREPNNTADRAMDLTFGKAVRGTVYPAKDVDYFRLDLTERPVRTPIRATLLGILKVDVGLYLHRVGPDGKLSLVQTSDRAKGDQPETIRYSAEPGVYVLEVRDAKNRESNFQDPYQLTVEEGE
ncbi:ABC transporter substrate-binding protein [Hyalangium versicolor]|uniref:ABC transporter substrate-binding protein n=1 Tax=Hyalangium versicolor TaxID=2861190 RepID=UPI001CCF3FA3|nr:ABC transporter substrate-binding protein [Hyalangium versicolor]